MHYSVGGGTSIAQDASRTYPAAFPPE